MRVLVMGTGGVGGYYGGLLAHAGHEVTFVARGAHLAAMRERGLEVRTGGITFTISPAQATDDPATVGDVGLALFTVKTYDTAPALAALRPAVGPGTAVLTLQNGIDSVDQLSAAFGIEKVIAGVTFVASAVAEPGVVVENGASRRVVIGEPLGGASERVEKIAGAFREAGIEVQVSADATQAIWDKFVLLAPHATVSAACQLPIGEIRQTPEAMQLYRDLVGEVIAVGNALGRTFVPDRVDQIIDFFMGAPPGQTSSLQRDFANQRRVELEYLTGTVIRRGRERGILTPRFDALYAVLKARAHSFGGLA